MSPYRVLVNSNGRSEEQILAAMLSVNKITQDRDIYIVQKTLSSEDFLLDKRIAHLQSTRRNTVILDKYTILREFEDMRSYKVRHCESLCILKEVELTQQDCLRAAMHDYCSRQNLEMVQVL